MFRAFDAMLLGDLTEQAKASPRRRQHRNIHGSYQEQVQRFFNAIEPGSYIRPHRHSRDPRDELVVAIRGEMALVTFDDDGVISKIVRFGTEKHGHDIAVGAEVWCSTWHTVVALEPGCVLLEVKAGPFDPCCPKDFAPWAPEVGTHEAEVYVAELTARAAASL